MNIPCANKVKKRNVKKTKSFGITTIPSAILANNKINQRIFAAGLEISLILNLGL